MLRSTNGKLVKDDETGVAVHSSAALYGRGCFTTIAINGGAAFLWAKHWRRLSNDSAKIGLDISEIEEQTVAAWLSELIAANGMDHGKARVTFLDASTGAIWPLDGRRGTIVSIVTAGAREAAVEFSLTISPYTINSRSPLAGVKSCNYLENLIAIEAARAEGFNEAVRVNERGEIASATMANIFWCRGGELFTPALSTGCLAGTTREFVLERLECREAVACAEDLDRADEIFLTSAGIGVRQATSFNGRKLCGEPHPITDVWPL